MNSSVNTPVPGREYCFEVAGVVSSCFNFAVQQAAELFPVKEQNISNIYGYRMVRQKEIQVFFISWQ
jgi:hypothetical protein